VIEVKMRDSDHRQGWYVLDGKPWFDEPGRELGYRPREYRIREDESVIHLDERSGMTDPEHGKACITTLGMLDPILDSSRLVRRIPYAPQDSGDEASGHREQNQCKRDGSFHQ
jgi:hypothetical protein